MAAIWPLRLVNPVMFPPGLPRLETSPTRTGSPTATMTMGMVVVAFLAARLPGVFATTMTFTGSFVSSAASSGRRSGCPSADRYS